MNKLRHKHNIIDKQRINVALTRCKNGLILICSFDSKMIENNYHFIISIKINQFGEDILNNFTLYVFKLLFIYFHF